MYVHFYEYFSICIKAAYSISMVKDFSSKLSKSRKTLRVTEVFHVSLSNPRVEQQISIFKVAAIR